MTFTEGHIVRASYFMEPTVLHLQAAPTDKFHSKVHWKSIIIHREHNHGCAGKKLPASLSLKWQSMVAFPARFIVAAIFFWGPVFCLFVVTRRSRFIRRAADHKKFISLCSLLVAVGEDSDIWKWYGIKRKRLIEFMLITWDLEEKVFCCNHP